MISVNAKEKFCVSARRNVKRHEFRMSTTVPCLRQAPSRRAIMREFATLKPFETLELDSPGWPRCRSTRDGCQHRCTRNNQTAVEFLVRPLIYSIS
jgi:hypothetical protein